MHLERPDPAVLLEDWDRPALRDRLEKTDQGAREVNLECRVNQVNLAQLVNQEEMGKRVREEKRDQRVRPVQSVLQVSRARQVLWDCLVFQVNRDHLAPLGPRASLDP